MKTKLNRTRDALVYLEHYISGKTVDVGAGSAKYKSIIKKHTSEYITFDSVSGDNIDIVGDVLDMPFKDSSFDTVVSTQVLEHVKKPWIMISEISRILKTGGTCILTAPFITPYHSDPYDYFRFTKDGMLSLFQDDFEIIECGPYGKTFMVFFESIKQVYFSPYSKNKRGIWSDRFLRYFEKLCFFFDKFVKNKQIYANVYIVARKK